jgi:putative transposase
VPRSDLDEVQRRRELDGPCLYFLIAQSGTATAPRVYVGEADGFRTRIKSHELEKEWWSSLVVFYSGDGSLVKSGIQYLESLCVKRLRKAGWCHLDNGNNPALPTVPEEDVGGLVQFFENVTIIMPVLSFNIFAEAPASEPGGEAMSDVAEVVSTAAFDTIVCPARQEGLKVPRRQPKRDRLWLNDGSCVRLRPLHKDHVWSYDFVADRTDDGRPLRMLTIMDEYTRECLAIDVERRLASEDVVERLADLFVARGTPGFIRSDNGPEFTAKVVRAWLARLGVKTLFIEPGSPWENGYIESFNGKFRDELLNGEILTTLQEAKVLVEQWRRHYNTKRPHSSLKRRPPAPETILPWPPGFAPLRQVATMEGLT